MFSPRIIAAKAAQIEAKLPIKLKEHTLDEVDRWVDQINSSVSTDDAGRVTRKRELTEEEKQFISNELLMSKISFPYYASRYVWVRRDKGGDVRFHFWESQELMLRALSAIEEASKPMLIINLKARQVGSSTLSEAILTHKVLTTPSITSLLAADEAKQSEFLFNMMERIFNHLPFWMRPHRLYNVK